MEKINTTLYFITDSTGFDENEFLYRVEEALKGGVTLLQLREKEPDTRRYIYLAEKVHILTKKYNVPLIIDDRVDVAMAIDAEGVHLGQSDMPVKIARKILGENMIIGATTKTVPQALEAYSQGADYLGVGAIYPTTTKVKTVLTSTETLVVTTAGLRKTYHPLPRMTLKLLTIFARISVISSRTRICFPHGLPRATISMPQM